jgi:hypothetical protein
MEHWDRRGIIEAHKLAVDHLVSNSHSTQPLTTFHLVTIV